MHARLLHGNFLLEPAYLDRANAAKRASVAVTVYIAFRRRSGDLILVNARLAKPIQPNLVYSRLDEWAYAYFAMHNKCIARDPLPLMRGFRAGASVDSAQ
jgi:hypothetical protein